MNSISLKQQFMNACAQPVRDAPGEPTVEERRLNLALILEELYELARDGYGMEGTFQQMMLDKFRQNGQHDVWLNHYEAIACDRVDDTRKYDPVATLDALCDIRVVADGPILSSGLQGVWEEAMGEVHASNMSKFPTDMNDAAVASVHYKAQGIETVWGAVGERWVVRNAQTGKVLKPLSYFPPNLAQFLPAVVNPNTGK